MVENSGLNTFKIVDPTVVNRDDLPNTAKLVTAALSPGDAPLTVKSDPQFLGDILGGKSTAATFNVKVRDDAAPGAYTLPLQVTYTYLREAEQYGADSIRYVYDEKTETLPLTVTITPDLRVEVTDARSEHLNVGSEGYLYLTLKNVGHETATNAVAKIVRNGDSPIIPTDGSAYIGTLAPGDEVTATFKASVSTDAGEQSYPLDLMVAYTDSDGDASTTRTVTLGLPVGGKTDFAVVSSTASLSPGAKSVLEVVYKNVGVTTVYNAQARISAVDPFTSNDDTAYLGDIAPGETVTARFEMNVDADATQKMYGLDSEIRYRDALDNSHISDTMKVQVNVAAQEGGLMALANPLVLGIVVLGLIGAGYYVLVFRKKHGKTDEGAF
jgi:hypothetical protein